MVVKRQTRKKSSSASGTDQKKGANGKNKSASVLETTGSADSVLAQGIAQENKNEIESKKEKAKGKTIEKTDEPLTHEDLMRINSREGLVEMLGSRRIKLDKVVDILRYEEELALLQVQLVKFQHWVQSKKKRVAILFEGRDAAGKGGTIRRFTEHLNPRSIRVVALPAPTDVEQGQWYFQRYAKHLPNPGEIVFFDRSWYNRAVVEPVNGFCTEKQYDRYIRQVPEFEHMLYEDGVHIVKIWFSISKEEQLRRFDSRRKNPLKQWKISPVDERAQSLWDKYSHYKQEMFARTHNSYSPWVVVQANVKRTARLESIRYVLNLFPYDKKGSSGIRLAPDPNIIGRFHRRHLSID